MPRPFIAPTRTIRSTGIETAYTSAQAGKLSRPDQVKEGSTVIASMRYLGLGTLVGLNYDAASNLNLTYQNGGTGDAGDKYTGLDRFGRIVETLWIKGSAEAVQTVYGRNRASGVLWRRDDEASSIIAMDALYEYDGLQQVTAWKRGNLAPGSGPPYTGINNQKQGEDFTYDQTGNWLGDVSDNPNFTQSRTHNTANQIVSITCPGGVIQPAYDNAGNMTVSPKPGAWNTGHAYKWDAWNRLVEIKQGGTTVATYAYDALTRRTRKTVGGVTRDIYYDRQWRSVEEREGSTVKVQHTWSPLDRWTLIRRKRNASGGTLNETLFCLRDYLDPIALANTSGNVVERYNYDPFGTVRIMNAAFGVKGSSSYDWNFLFHGEFIDDESGLYNYGYRYYDPQLGRWLSRDPIGERGGLNLYGFVLNNPVKVIDIMGLNAVEDCKTYIRKQNSVIENLVKNNLSEPPDCSTSKDCEKISVVVNLPHPCKPSPRSNNVGHAGLGVGKDYYDFGPGGPHWCDTNKTMTEVEGWTGSSFQGKENTVIFEFCVCKKRADQFRAGITPYQGRHMGPKGTLVPDINYNELKPYSTCSGAVSSAMGGKPWQSPRNLFDDLSDGENNHGFWYINECGSHANKKAFVKWTSKIDVNANQEPLREKYPIAERR